MLGYILALAILPCLFTGSSAQLTCPVDEFRGTVNATWGDPDVCRVYYHCVNDFPWPRQCPKDLHYNPTATGRDCTFRMCIPPSESNCVDSLNAAEKYQELLPYLETYDELEMEAEREIEEAQQHMSDELAVQNDYYPCFQDNDGNWVDTTLPNRLNCKQYYHCDRGIAWPSECPPTMYYTPQVGWLGPLEDNCEFTVCVQFEDAKCAIDGAWGSWGSWSDCSVNCGTGLRTRTRPCDSPTAVNGGDECPGTSIDVLVCQEGECKAHVTAVFAYRITDLITGQSETNPVAFEGLEVNTDNSFNVSDSSFTAQADGHYFMAINSGALALQPVNFYLVGDTGYPIGGRRTHRNHIGRDSINSNMILTMSGGSKVNIAAAPDTSFSADAGKPTSWAVFNIDDIGTASSMFAYAFDTPVTNPTNPLKFDVNVSDVNGGYDKNTGVFSPNLPGTYLITIGAGVDTSNTARSVDLTLNCAGTCGTFVPIKLTRTHDNYQGVDSMSRAVILDLPAGAQLSVSTTNATWSSFALQTSFTGFYYQPSNPNARVAWSVARTSDWSNSLAFDPVTFDRVMVNQGNGWGAEVSNYFTVPVSGYYLVTLSVGAMPEKRVDFRMYQNDAYIFDVYRQTQVHLGVDTVGRTGIFAFQQGDRLRIRAIGNSALYSSATGYETSFGGMLLFPSEEATTEGAAAIDLQEAEEMFEQWKLL